MRNAIGIVNYEGPNVQVKGMQGCRPVPAFLFLGRYRLIDFPISNLNNSGVNHIKVFVRTNPRSLLEHLGTGHYHNINSKRGKLYILPARGVGESDFYSNSINSCIYNMQTIEDANYPYVVLTPNHFVFRQDFNTLLSTYIENGADITMLYQNVDNAREPLVNCDVANLNKQKGVLSLERNHRDSKSRTISLETYILSKELLMDLVRKAANISSLYWFRDIVSDECAELDIYGVTHRGFVACINGLKSYYNANIDLLNYDKTMDLFHANWPVYTKASDSCPTRYYAGVSVKNSMAPNGCLVEGNIGNSVIGRGAIIKKGAVIKNCVILPDTMIDGDVHIENIVVDRKAGIVRKKELLSPVDTPLYVKRNDEI